MLRFRQCVLLATVVAVLLAVDAAQAERRVALVIGNDAYENLPALEKAAADAKGYAGFARSKGFDLVIERTNATRQAMDIAIAEFLEAIGPGDTALFVYSGHGWSDGGQNYLVGVDAPKSAPEALLSRLSIPLQNGVNGVLDEVDRRGASLKVAIVDACRDNPFAPTKNGRAIGIGRGLSRIDPPRGTFVVFSAGTGQVALDRLSNADPDPNGVFTRVFLPLLDEDRPLLTAVKAAQQKVFELALQVSHNQEPAYYDQVRGTACLSASCTTAAKKEPPPPAPLSMNPEVAFWTSIANSSDVADFDAYLQQFPQGVFVRLAKNRLAALNRPDKPEEVAPNDGSGASSSGTASDPGGTEANNKVAALAPPKTNEPVFDPTAITECDRRTAHPNNPDNPAGTVSVNFDAIKKDADAAIIACREAVEEHPALRRFAFQLGRALHATGHGDEAISWLLKAADQGSTSAFLNLGMLYADKKDYFESRRWFERSAETGDRLAMYSMGVLLGRGQGGPQDYKEAVRWYKKSVELGEPQAMFNLANLYSDGRGVERDYAEARRLYEKASGLGHAGATYGLGQLYYHGQGVAKDYGQARSWYLKAAEKQHASAMTQLGVIYNLGLGVKTDYAEARRWYEKAVALGELQAAHNLAFMLSRGQGGSKDVTRAKQLFREAMAGGLAWTFDQFRTNANAYDSVIRRDVQQLLIEKGYLSGGVDGVLGSKSKAALDSYQRAVSDSRS